MKTSLLILVTMFSFAWVHAQRIKQISGDVKPLNGEKAIQVQFTYNDMRVGKYDHEADYIEHKKEEYNKKESGRGDKWEEAWIGDRKARYEPNFIELFEKHSDFALGNYPNAMYTMMINTSRIEPGYNIYISRRNAEIDLEITIIETISKKEICSYSIKSAPGRTFGGYDYDTGLRIEEAYATAGKHFAKKLKGDLK